MSAADTGSELWATYVALWKRAQAAGIHVHYNGIANNPRSGGFHPRDGATDGGRRPMIEIVRPYYETHDEPTQGRNTGGAHLPPPDLLEELITLAHEFGHFLSWKQGNRTRPYVDATTHIERYFDGEDLPRLAEEQIQLVRDEERRAWTFGEEELRELGFADWDAFCSHKRDALDQYEIIFRWEPLPWHVRRLREWAESDDRSTRVEVRAFLIELDRFEQAIQPLSVEEREEWSGAAWPSRKAAIETLRRHQRGEVEENVVYAALQSHAIHLRGLLEGLAAGKE